MEKRNLSTSVIHLVEKAFTLPVCGVEHYFEVSIALDATKMLAHIFVHAKYKIKSNLVIRFWYTKVKKMKTTHINRPFRPKLE